MDIKLKQTYFVELPKTAQYHRSYLELSKENDKWEGDVYMNIEGSTSFIPVGRLKEFAEALNKILEIYENQCN